MKVGKCKLPFAKVGPDTTQNGQNFVKRLAKLIKYGNLANCQISQWLRFRSAFGCGRVASPRVYLGGGFWEAGGIRSMIKWLVLVAAVVKESSSVVNEHAACCADCAQLGCTVARGDA